MDDDYSFSLKPEKKEISTDGLSAEKLVLDSYGVKGFDQPLEILDDYMDEAVLTMEPIELQKQTSIDRSHTQIHVEMRMPEPSTLQS